VGGGAAVVVEGPKSQSDMEKVEKKKLADMAAAEEVAMSSLQRWFAEDASAHRYVLAPGPSGRSEALVFLAEDYNYDSNLITGVGPWSRLLAGRRHGAGGRRC